MENNLVVKANKLVEARSRLSRNEQKVLLHAISKLDHIEQTSFNTIEMDIKEFAELIEVKGKMYEELRDIVRGLRKKEVIIDTPEKEYITGWLSSITLNKGTGKMKIRFDEDLVPYLLQLKEHFTRYELKNILYLKSIHAIRLYELLKCWEYRKKPWKLEMDEFRRLMMLEEQYERPYDLKKRVLDPSKKDINKHTDINIDYELIEYGRSYSHIEFTIEPKNIEKEIYIEYLNEVYKVKDMKFKMGLHDEKFSTEQIINIYNKAVEYLGDRVEMDIFEYVRLNYLELKRTKGVTNPYGLLLKYLELDKAAAKGQISMNYFIYPEDKK